MREKPIDIDNRDPVAMAEYYEARIEALKRELQDTKRQLEQYKNSVDQSLFLLDGTTDEANA